VLPLTYQPAALQRYFARRPGAVAQRVFQVLSASFGVVAGVAWDKATGAKDVEVKVRKCGGRVRGRGWEGGGA
jgi:hypothetical protein